MSRKKGSKNKTYEQHLSEAKKDAEWNVYLKSLKKIKIKTKAV